MGGSRSCGIGHRRVPLLRERRSVVGGNSRTLTGTMSCIAYRGLRSLWSLTHGYENHALRAVFRGVFPTIKILPPLRGSIWCVTLPWVSLCSTHGCVMSPLRGSVFCRQLRFLIVAYKRLLMCRPAGRSKRHLNLL